MLTGTKGLRRTLTVLVDRASNQLLARAAFAQNQHGGIRRGHPANLPADVLQGRAVPQHVDGLEYRLLDSVVRHTSSFRRRQETRPQRKGKRCDVRTTTQHHCEVCSCENFCLRWDPGLNRDVAQNARSAASQNSLPSRSSQFNNVLSLPDAAITVFYPRALFRCRRVGPRIGVAYGLHRDLKAYSRSR